MNGVKLKYLFGQLSLSVAEAPGQGLGARPNTVLMRVPIIPNPMWLMPTTPRRLREGMGRRIGIMG